jgi:hypothetical protein
MPLTNHSLTLLHSQASISKHTHLLNNMSPVTFNLQFLNVVEQHLSSLHNSATHSSYFLQILGKQSLIPANLIDNSSSVLRRVGVHRSNDQLQLTQCLSSLVFILTNKVHCAHTLSIHTEIFGEGLGEHKAESFLSEMSD